MSQSLTLNETMENGERPLAARMLDLLKRRDEQAEVAMLALATIASNPRADMAWAASVANEAINTITGIASDISE